MECFCYFNVKSKSNVYDCQNRRLNSMPQSIPTDTQWMNLARNNISEVCGEFGYMTDINHIELQYNTITELCGACVKSMGHMNYIDISNNQLSSLPMEVTELSNMTLYIGSNPYSCSCSVLWMANWLNISTATSVVKDYRNVRCKHGKRQAVGKAIFELTKENLDCFGFPIVPVVMPCVVVALTMIVGFTIFRNLDRIKFFLFLKTSIRLNEDDHEDTDIMEFDALVAYRYSHNTFMIWVYYLQILYLYIYIFTDPYIFPKNLSVS